jgi:hypothetical protein
MHKSEVEFLFFKKKNRENGVDTKGREKGREKVGRS